MNDEQQILEILIDRDIRAFVAGDWRAVRDDFDIECFTGYSGAGGTVRLEFPSLEAYRESWVTQAAELGAGSDPEILAAQLGAVQRVERIEVAGDRALATKVFDGVIELSGGAQQELRWTTYYFLRLDRLRRRWLITGFVGYLPRERNMA